MDWKIAVLSDTHGDREVIRCFREAEKGADLLIHCGDSEFQSGDPALSGFAAVQGNCDPPGAFPEHRMLEAGDLRILAVHGHIQGVKSGMLGLRYEAAERDADLVLFGHTHRFGAVEDAGTLFVNPGSAAKPWPGNPPTYAVIEKEGDQVTVRFKKPDGTEAAAQEFINFPGRR
ncbi:metallophosphoesterase [Bhargavaea cecembensis]|uniref:metallophosphoesterase n=1 Tax=Bhargavaea cecembensis TaxID=394098 RepID=UPI00069324A1|nr:metallophosphoesterase [Bhargavaea cecembensis]